MLLPRGMSWDAGQNGHSMLLPRGASWDASQNGLPRGSSWDADQNYMRWPSASNLLPSTGGLFPTAPDQDHLFWARKVLCEDSSAHLLPDSPVERPAAALPPPYIGHGAPFGQGRAMAQRRTRGVALEDSSGASSRGASSSSDGSERRGFFSCGSDGWGVAKLPAHRSLAAPKRLLSLGPSLRPFSERAKEVFYCQCDGADEERIRSMMREAKAPVVLNVYAVSTDESIQKVNRVTRNFLRHGGVFHGAIEVHGQEWSYGGTEDDASGIFCNEPRMCTAHTFRESIYLGDCRKKPYLVEFIIEKMTPGWMGRDYDLLRKNCCQFAEAFAEELGVGPLPGWLNRLAREGAEIQDDIKYGTKVLHHVNDEARKNTVQVRAYFREGHHANKADYGMGRAVYDDAL
jgi:hypothetical protein